MNKRERIKTVFFYGGATAGLALGYDAISGNDKEIWTVDDSEHCEIWIDHNQDYLDKVESFLSKYE